MIQIWNERSTSENIEELCGLSKPTILWSWQEISIISQREPIEGLSLKHPLHKAFFSYPRRGKKTLLVLEKIPHRPTHLLFLLLLISSTPLFPLCLRFSFPLLHTVSSYFCSSSSFTIWLQLVFQSPYFSLCPACSPLSIPRFLDPAIFFCQHLPLGSSSQLFKKVNLTSLSVNLSYFFSIFFQFISNFLILGYTIIRWRETVLTGLIRIVFLTSFEMLMF